MTEPGWNARPHDRLGSSLMTGQAHDPAGAWCPYPVRGDKLLPGRPDSATPDGTDTGLTSSTPWAARMGLSLRSCPGSRVGSATWRGHDSAGHVAPHTTGGNNPNLYQKSHPASYITRRSTGQTRLLPPGGAEPRRQRERKKGDAEFGWVTPRLRTFHGRRHESPLDPAGEA